MAPNINVLNSTSTKNVTIIYLFGFILFINSSNISSISIRVVLPVNIYCIGISKSVPIKITGDSKKIIIINNRLSGFIYSSFLFTYYLVINYLSLIINESNLYLLSKYLLPTFVLNIESFS